MMKTSLVCLYFLSLINFSISSSEAKLVQILHTNDTHSFLDKTNHDKEVGGSARLKGLMDSFKESAKKMGIETIALDGGDFLEGNIYYMADQGQKSFEVHNQVGYDAVVIGNHDYLMGAKHLDKILGNLDLNFTFLGANVLSSSQFPNIRNKIKPYKELVIDGVKVAILGLTTSDFFFSWSLEGSQIVSPYKVAKEYEQVLKDRKNDFIIALTHIGVNRDIRLASKTNYIDLIVGGHSHTALTEPVYEENKRKIPVPIVQSGFHTKYLGRIIVDMTPGQALKVVSYELVPVTNQIEDNAVKSMVAEADDSLDTLYGKEWLNEIIGFSDLKESDHSGSRKWAYFISDALREKSIADIAIHVSSMNGENYPIGPISRRDVMNSIPRVFELNETKGWSIYTSRVSGSLLKILCESLAYFGQPISFSGITIEWIKTPFGIKIAKARVNGKRINPFKTYTVAFTEGIIRGAIEISPKTKAILRQHKKTPYKIWQTLEEKIEKDNNSFAKITEKNHAFYFPE